MKNEGEEHSMEHINNHIIRKAWHTCKARPLDLKVHESRDFHLVCSPLTTDCVYPPKMCMSEP